MLQALWLSLEISVLATIIALGLGGALAWLLATRRFVGRDLLDAAITTLLVLPPTVLGYYLLTGIGPASAFGRMFEGVFHRSIAFTRLGAVVAAAIGALPLVVRAGRAAFETVDPTLLGVARTLGAGRWRTLWSIHLPLAAPGLVAAGLLAFARSLGDFGMTMMVAGNMPGETQTAALFVYDALGTGDDYFAGGMAALLLAIGLGVAYAVITLERRRG